MGRNLLSAARCRTAGPGKLGDGGGLYLVKQPSGAGQWHYRFSHGGKRREMGLGPYPVITLAAARAERDRWESVRVAGRDPIEERARERRRATAPGRTLREVTAAAFEAEKATLRDEGKAGRWLSPLTIHVMPHLGDRDVESLDQNEIEAVLKPLWKEKPTTAKKALNRLAKVMRYGAARGLTVDLNAVPLARALLGDPGHQTKHIAAMPWQEVPAFYKKLTDGTPTTLALRLLILTGARSRPVRFAHVDQFNGDVWTIPGEGDGARQKGLKGKVPDFRVPLAVSAQAVVAEAADQSRDGFLFPGLKRGVISDASMAATMKRAGLDYRPHGFRSSLKTWAIETGAADEDLIERQLGHVVGSQVGRAYMRSDLLEERRRVIESWERHVKP